MTKLIVGIIVVYHSILRVLGKMIGLLTAGLFVGFTEGVSAIRDMHKYMKYHMARTQQERWAKEKEKKDDSGRGSP